MKVTFYGKLADILGRELDLAMETPCTIAGLRERIVASFPAAFPMGDKRVRACIGGAIVLDDHPVTPTEEVEFLAPVSGG